MNINLLAIAALVAAILRPHSMEAQGTANAASFTGARDKTERLVNSRDAAALKAFEAWTRLRAAGVAIDSLGFDLARSTRDWELSAAKDAMEKLTAYERHAQTARRLEAKLRDEVRRGTRAADFLDIARFEVLRAAVELAQAQDLLSAADYEQSAIRSYEWALTALQAERRKLKAGRSTLFVVHRLAWDLRDQDLQMSKTSSQRTAALARYAALIHELEDYAATESDRMITQRWSKDAKAELERAKTEAR